MDKGAWFSDAVTYAYIHGLFNGTGENTFSPYDTMTRAMFITVIGRMTGADVSKYQSNIPSSDADMDPYYAPYIAWTTEHGITEGMGVDIFLWNEPLNREQMATLIVHLFDAFGYTYPEENVTGSPRNLDSISGYAAEPVLKLWECGIIKGDNEGRFNPKSNATRAECATFLMRIDEHLVNIGAKKYDVEETYYVTFQDGNRFIDKLAATANKPLGAVPPAEKTARENAIFVGWFVDEALTTPFYPDNAVTGNMTVYAKYVDLPGETLNLTSFTQLNQSPALSFEVVKTAEAAVSPEEAFTLIPRDGSEPVPLKWTVNGDIYTILADGGFNEGCSYELTLAQGYNFKDKPDTIRTASFTIDMEEIDNLKMSDDIIYIKDTEDMDYIIGDKTYEVLVPSLVPENGGKFDYANASSLKVNDIICFYTTTNPKDRDYINNSYINDPEIYAKVLDISGTTITFGAFDEEDANVLYKIPDNFPVIVPVLPTEDTIFIASVGHCTSASFAESKISSDVISSSLPTAFPSSSILNTSGHISVHKPQPMHNSLSTCPFMVKNLLNFYAINILISLSAFVILPIPNFLTSTSATPGDRNAGRVGPR